ncbi:MAG: orotate phosphoribosyltransferase [Bacteroidota bacterium]
MDANATVAQCRARLAELIKEHALRFGDFTLASGRKSTYFIDGKLVTLQSEGAYCLARCILDMIGHTEVEAVGGMTIGADPIAGAVVALAGASGRDLLGFLVRKQQKDHGTRKQVEGPIAEGAKVIMLEDVVTTGGSTLDAIEAMEREKDAEVLGVIAMVDRLQGAEENLAAKGYKLQSVFTIAELGVKV